MPEWYHYTLGVIVPVAFVRSATKFFASNKWKCDMMDNAVFSSYAWALVNCLRLYIEYRK